MTRTWINVLRAHLLAIPTLGWWGSCVKYMHLPLPLSCRRSFYTKRMKSHANHLCAVVFIRHFDWYHAIVVLIRFNWMLGCAKCRTGLSVTLSIHVDAAHCQWNGTENTIFISSAPSIQRSIEASMVWGRYVNLFLSPPFLSSSIFPILSLVDDSSGSSSNIHVPRCLSWRKYEANEPAIAIWVSSHTSIHWVHSYWLSAAAMPKHMKMQSGILRYGNDGSSTTRTAGNQINHVRLRKPIYME